MIHPKLDCASLSANIIVYDMSTCEDPPPPSPDTKVSFTEPDDEVPEHSVTIRSSVSSTSTRTKRGYRELTSTLTCGVLFESDPVWLWAIRPNSWSAIYITGPDEARLRQDHPVLSERLDAKLVVIPTTFRGDFPSISPEFMWVSGRKNFIDMVELGGSGQHVYWLAHSTRRCPNDGMISWTKVLHRNVGGVTEARGTFGIDRRSSPIMLERDLNRFLSHVIKYAIRPEVCDPSGPDKPHYKLEDRLSLSFPRRPVLYPTYMSRTGWGIRSLQDTELAACFELPDYLGWEDRFIRDIVPLQLFRSVIDCITGVNVQGPPIRSLAPPMRPNEASDPTDVVWLPGIARWLPGSWTDAVISDKAVKSDDAPIDFRPWNRRIQLLFPCSHNTIITLERFVARRWRFNICRSLFFFLRHRYGNNWLRDLSSPTLSKRSLAGSSSDTSRKRSRLSTTSIGRDEPDRGVGELN